MRKYLLFGILVISSNVFCMQSDSLLQKAYDWLEQPEQAHLKHAIASGQSFRIANASMRRYEKTKRDLGPGIDTKKFEPASNAVAFSYEYFSGKDQLSVVIATTAYVFPFKQATKFLKTIKFEESYAEAVNGAMFDLW